MSIRTLQFFKDGHFSPLIRMVKFSLLAMYGDRSAERNFRKIWQETDHELAFPAVTWIRQFLLQRIQQKGWNNRVYPYLKNYQTTGLSYANFELDPAFISQIKKIINACDHAIVVLTTVEQMDVEHLFELSSRNSAFKTYNEVPIIETIDHVYELCKLITQTDIDFSESFAAEWKVLRLFSFQLSDGLLNLSEDQSLEEFRHTLSQPTQLAEQIGGAIGTGIYQLGKPNGQIDYPFFTHLSAVLPLYLDQLSQYLHQYTDTLEKNTQLEINHFELEENAIALLNSLENMTHKSILYPQFAFDLISMLKSTSVLIWNVLYEVNQLTTTSQNFIKAQLKILKFDYIAGLLALSDKIEEEGLAAPGVLSNGVFQKINPIYQQLIHVLRRFVDFSVDGEHLLSLEEISFVQMRINYAYQRRAEKIYEIHKLNAQHLQVQTFFNLLKKHEGHSFLQLDQVSKTELIMQYQSIQSLIGSLDEKINQSIILFLTGKSIFYHHEADWLSQLNIQLVELADESLNPVHFITHLLKFQSIIELLIKKKHKTLEFHQAVSQDITGSIYQSQDYLMLTHAQIEWTYVPSDKPLEDFRALLSQYEHISEARHAFQSFCHILTENKENLSFQNQHRLRNLYIIFRPILSGIAFKSLNQELIKIFSEKSRNALIDVFVPYQNQIAQALIANEQAMQSHLEQLKIKALNEDLKQVSTSELKYFPKKRSTFLIKQAGIAAYMTKAQQSLPEFYQWFQLDVQKELTVKEKSFLQKTEEVLTFSLNKLPFPEIVEPISALSEPRHILWLKRFINQIAHFEEASIQLELLNQLQIAGNHPLFHLNNQRLKIIFVARAFKIEHHVREGIWFAMDLMNDIHLSTFYKKVYQDFAPLHQRVGQLQQLYRVQDSSQAHHQTYEMIYSIVNALFITPISLKSSNKADTRDAREEAKQFTQEIYRLLEQSSLSFKLFLEIPACIRLLLKFKTKVGEFARVVHHQGTQYLNEIERDIFIPLLTLADSYEEYFLLQPGMCSISLESLLNAVLIGILDSLKIESNQYITLRTHRDTLLKRLEASTNRLIQYQNYSEIIVKNKQRVKSLLSLYDLNREWDEQSQYIIIREINACMELLKEAKPVCFIVYRKHAHESIIDHLLNDQLISTHFDRFDHHLFKQLLNVYLQFVEGELKSNFWFQKGCETQQKFLQQSLLQQDNVHLNILKEYVQKKLALTELVRPYTGLHTQLIHARDFYDVEVQNFIRQETPDIQTSICLDKDIDQQIKELVSVKMKTFKMEKLRYFQQLEGLMNTIDQFKHYLGAQYTQLNHTLNWQFETEQTLEPKQKLLNQLEALIQDNQLSIEEKLNRLQVFIKKPQFKQTLLTYHKYEAFTFQWLMQCICDFLAFIKIYKPERQKIYDNLLSSNSSFFASKLGQSGVIPSSAPQSCDQKFTR